MTESKAEAWAPRFDRRTRVWLPVMPRWQPSRVRLGDPVDCAPGREVTLTGDDGRVVCVAGTVPGSRVRELAAVMADEDLRSSGALRWLE